MTREARSAQDEQTRDFGWPLLPLWTGAGDPAAYEPREGDTVEVRFVGTVKPTSGSLCLFADGLFLNHDNFVAALTEGRVTLVHREPALPEEPPNGTVCRGADDDLWQRRDVYGVPESHWWLNGLHCSYDRALELGLDPTRRLIELPDPHDRATMEELGRKVFEVARDPKLHLDDWAYTVLALRALSEQGAPDA